MIHLVLQGKGGVGKTYVSAILAQYLRAKGADVLCYDTDPVNATFSRFEALDVQYLDLIRDDHIDQGRFDDFFATLMTVTQEVVIDNGASSFDPLTRYLYEADVIPILHDAGQHLALHTVVAGGNACEDSITGFNDLAENFGALCPLYVWRNEYFGDIVLDGVDFEATAIYRQHRHVVEGIIRMRRYNPDTYGKDITQMLNRKLTFDETLALADVIAFSKSRLQRVKTEFFQILDVVLHRPAPVAPGEPS